MGPAGYGEARALTSTKASTRQRSRGLPGSQPASRPVAFPGRVLAGSPVVRHLVILAGYLATGIALTWPRVTYLTGGKLPATRDAGVYVWDFWWMAHQVEHLGNPWFTRFIAAPVGAQLGYHALMPLEGLVMLPGQPTRTPRRQTRLIHSVPVEGPFGG